MERWDRFWFGEIDSLRLQVFRICLGIALLCYMAFRWQYAQEWLTEAGFHLPVTLLPYHSVAVPLMPVAALGWGGILFFVSIMGFIVGWHWRVFGWMAWMGLVYVTLADQLAAFSPNKILIATIFIILCSPRGRLVPAWPVRVLQTTIIIHLFMAGWVKVAHGEWLQDPYVFFTQVQGTYRTAFAAWLLQVLPKPAWAYLQLGALLFELLLPVLLLVRKFRWIAYVWGTIFQLMIALTMEHLIFFNLIMLSYFILFMEINKFLPEWLQKRVVESSRY